LKLIELNPKHDFVRFNFCSTEFLHPFCRTSSKTVLFDKYDFQKDIKGRN